MIIWLVLSIFHVHLPGIAQHTEWFALCCTCSSMYSNNIYYIYIHKYQKHCSLLGILGSFCILSKNGGFKRWTKNGRGNSTRVIQQTSWSSGTADVNKIVGIFIYTMFLDFWVSIYVKMMMMMMFTDIYLHNPISIWTLYRAYFTPPNVKPQMFAHPEDMASRAVTNNPKDVVHKLTARCTDASNNGNTTNRAKKSRIDIYYFHDILHNVLYVTHVIFQILLISHWLFPPGSRWNLDEKMVAFQVQFERTPSGVLFKFRPLTVKDVGGPRGSWRWVETCRNDAGWGRMASVSGFALRTFCGGPMTIIYYIIIGIDTTCAVIMDHVISGRRLTFWQVSKTLLWTRHCAPTALGDFLWLSDTFEVLFVIAFPLITVDQTWLAGNLPFSFGISQPAMWLRKSKGKSHLSLCESSWQRKKHRPF